MISARRYAPAAGRPIPRPAAKIRKQGIAPRLDALKPAQREELIRWLTVERIRYDVARARVREQFKLEVSVNALSRFFQNVCAPRLIAAQIPREPQSLTMALAIAPNGDVSGKVIQ